MDIKKANRDTLEEAQRQVSMLVEDLRTINQDGIDLYRDKNGGTNQNLYNQEFEKKRKKAHKKMGISQIGTINIRKEESSNEKF